MGKPGSSVDAWIDALEHPLKPVVVALRSVVLRSHPLVAEEIKWNVPSFSYSGPLPPSDPKDYRKYLVNFNVFRNDAVRLVFLRADGLDDPGRLLTGDYQDGRRLASFASVAEVVEKAKSLASILQQLVARMP